MSVDEPAYKTQLLLLDLLTSWDDKQQTISEPAFDLLVRELNDAGAITATMDDSAPEPELALDMGPLLSGAGALLNLTVGVLAAQTGLDRLALIHSLRESVHAAHRP
jgi:hypothetical protein